MATITTGHDTTAQTQTARPVAPARKQTPIWVMALAAPMALLLIGGGARLVTELQDGLGAMSGSALIR